MAFSGTGGGFGSQPLSPNIRNRILSVYGDPDFTQGVLNGMEFYQDTVITSAQLLALNTTPITLVAAPTLVGSSTASTAYALLPNRLYATMVFNSIAYTANAAGAIVKYTDGSGVAPGLVLTQTFLQSAATSQQMVNCSATAYTPTAGAALVLHAGSANPASGNSPLTVRIYYYVVQVPLP